MVKINNPFAYDQANNLKEDQILDYYIEDYNYSRFIESTRNIFLVGERGCGKSMTLLYNSFRIKKRKALREKKALELDKIGIYIGCNTHLFHKQEYELIENNRYKEAVLSEHYFVLYISFCLVDTLMEIDDLLDQDLNDQLKLDFEYIIGETLPKDKPFLDAIKLYIQKQNVTTQHLINKPNSDNFYDSTFSFYSFIMPLINFLKKIPKISSTHFLFLVDDVHDLNEYQAKSLNSWIAFRDHSDFSFKVSVAKVRNITFKTATGGGILEGHDFLMIDLEEPFQNKFSDFGKLAKKIIERRLTQVGIEKNVNEYFPIHEDFKSDLEQCKKEVTEKAIKLYGLDEKKKVTDYVYKYARAEYYRKRLPQANLPPYSGFETITHLSTGVIRNLLYPCFFMFDKAYSDLGQIPQEISPAIQDSIIKEKSKELWERITEHLAETIPDCTVSEAKTIVNLFQNLAVLFKERLKQEISEPRAIAFTISEFTDELKEKIMPLLYIAREAQILYMRTGSAKDDGKRETYFVPNRLLWPEFGLDVVGQHARVSLLAKDIYAAAFMNKKFDSKIRRETNQTELFDEQA